MNLLFNAIGGKLKFQAQDSDLEYFVVGFEKHIALSEKKTPLDRTERKKHLTFLEISTNLYKLYKPRVILARVRYVAE